MESTRKFTLLEHWGATGLYPLRYFYATSSVKQCRGGAQAAATDRLPRQKHLVRTPTSELAGSSPLHAAETAEASCRALGHFGRLQRSSQCLVSFRLLKTLRRASGPGTAHPLLAQELEPRCLAHIDITSQAPLSLRRSDCQNAEACGRLRASDGLGLQKDDMRLNNSQFRSPHTGILYTPPRLPAARIPHISLNASRRPPRPGCA